ncbi:MAG TPA: hypothetical protein PKD24_09315 [Pyrinomonadaceae bacterium]|nr:hypothetical protein [Pyrinomonadaceae bacterium]HMP65733.1 hypothetical protein [Pyrinomonadaceae bacterium]
MQEVFVKFADSELSGVVPVGTYVADCFSRFGFRPLSRCSGELGEHHCKFVAIAGAALLSKPTETEVEFLGGNEGVESVRLGCQTFFEEPGEIEIKMEHQPEEEEGKSDEATNNGSGSESYREVFSKLPLEKKIAELAHLEAVAFNETVAYVINSPYKVFDKVLDVFSELGLRKEMAERAASVPPEHRTESADGDRGVKQVRKRKPKSTSANRDKMGE